jgi:hypothetical protein
MHQHSFGCEFKGCRPISETRPLGKGERAIQAFSKYIKKHTENNQFVILTLNSVFGSLLYEISLGLGIQPCNMYTYDHLDKAILASTEIVKEKGN